MDGTEHQRNERDDPVQAADHEAPSERSAPPQPKPPEPPVPMDWQPGDENPDWLDEHHLWTYYQQMKRALDSGYVPMPNDRDGIESAKHLAGEISEDPVLVHAFKNLATFADFAMEPNLPE